MASRTAITRLTSQPLASSSRIPWMAPTSHPLPHRKAIAHLRPPKTSTLPISGYRRRASTSVAPHPSPGLPPISLKLKMRVTPPSLRAIQEEGYQNDDVVLIPSHEAVLILTPEAVQVSHTRLGRDLLADRESAATCFYHVAGAVRCFGSRKARAPVWCEQWRMSWLSVHHGVDRGTRRR